MLTFYKILSNLEKHVGVTVIVVQIYHVEAPIIESFNANHCWVSSVKDMSKNKF